ncbi:purine-nucleoside phosphorylase [Aliidiomarina celeris]|uniref:purine-nucleoside phosphorylase n=1 Tax=Aliidiomarina celeris TaxID=2249428 RepID=UPI000DE80C7B|nr:purine-nucleoside phosphorylase [Aliidiomarina celeris]
MATPHISAKTGDIAEHVIMPGDPLRAEFIAKNWLTDLKLVSRVRNVLAYTGRYNHTDITLMASGMGMPSIGIYSWELFKVYGVQKILRVGTCGTYSSSLSLMDVVLADYAWTNSNFAACQSGKPQQTAYPSPELNNHLEATALVLETTLPKARVHTTDVFYQEPNISERWLAQSSEVDVVDMESFALFYTAARFQRQAATLLTVTDSLVTGEGLNAYDRQQALVPMIELALNAFSSDNLANTP